jgi:hypothetical protein
MQKGTTLEFACTHCGQPVKFSPLASTSSDISCPSCQTPYEFGKKIIGQLKQFQALCQQIHESKEILGMAEIGIDVGEHQVKIPFKLLLTRFNNQLNLTIGDRPLTLLFRMEP